MNRKLTISLMILGFALSTFAQAPKETAAKKKDTAKVYKADAKDVESIDSIMKAVYAVISGGVGEKRNWDRFYSLFHPSARLIPTGTNRQTGVHGARSFTPEGYQKQSGSFLVSNGFRESEIGRKVDRFGNIAQVFSAYEGKFTQNGQQTTIRGINSFQLMNDGKRWWVMTIFWQAETPNTKIPEKYLSANMTRIENINPESMNADFGHLLVHGKKVSNPESLLYISGQIGMKKDGTLGKDCTEQLDIAWANVDAILADAGMGRANIIEVFVFINGAPQHDVESNKKLYAESVVNYFGENVPAMSALVSAGLWTDDLCFEFKVTAAK